MNLYEDINSNLKEQTYTIKQTAGNFGTYTLCDWESTSPEKAVEEFLEQNPEFKDGKKGHISAVLKESDDKVCVLCGKHFKEWGNDPWPLADEGWCCDKCNMDKVIPARIAMASKKEEPKTEEKKEAEYGNGTRHYSEALIDLCEQGIVNWRTVAEGLINYCSEDDIEDFCRMYEFKDLIDNPTGDDSLEDWEV